MACKNNETALTEAPKLTDTWWNCQYVENGECLSKKFIFNSDGSYQEERDSAGSKTGNWYWYVPMSIIKLEFPDPPNPTIVQTQEITKLSPEELVMQEQNFIQIYHYSK